MSELTDAEESHGWKVEKWAGIPSFEWRGEVIVTESGGVRVCVSADHYNACFEEKSDVELDGLILALLQAKDIHRRLCGQEG